MSRANEKKGGRRHAIARGVSGGGLAAGALTWTSRSTKEKRKDGERLTKEFDEVLEKDGNSYSRGCVERKNTDH